MLTFPLSPGVYVDELENLSFSADRAATAVPVFVTGPSAEQPWWTAALQPVMVRSFSEYENWLRSPPASRSRQSLPGFYSAAPARHTRRPAHWPSLAGISSSVATGGVDWNAPLAPALKAFFENGGSWCYLCPSDQLDMVKGIPDATLVVQAGQPAALTGILVLCMEGSGLFALLDGPHHAGGTFEPEILDQYLSNLSSSDHAALYHPWLKADWRLRNADGGRVAEIYPVAPSAVAAGLICSTDRQTGPWKAPANLTVSSGLTPQVKVGDKIQARYTSADFTTKSVNMFREFSGHGVQLWGARTLTAGGSTWGHIPVRRTFDMIERDMQLSLATALFEPNGSATWQRLRATAENYLNGLMQQGAFAGSTAADSYRVEVGEGITMSTADVLAGILRLRLQLAVVRPAEFVVLEFSQRWDAAGSDQGGALVPPDPDPGPDPVKEYVLAEQQLPAFAMSSTGKIDSMGGSLAMDSSGEKLAVSGSTSSSNVVMNIFTKSGANWELSYDCSPGNATGREVTMDGSGNNIALGIYGLKVGTIMLVWETIKQWQRLDITREELGLDTRALGGSVNMNSAGTLVAAAAHATIVEGFSGAGLILLFRRSGDQWKVPGRDVDILTLGDLVNNNDNLGYEQTMDGAGELLVATAINRRNHIGEVFTWTWQTDEWQREKMTLYSDDSKKFGVFLSMDKAGRLLAISSTEEEGGAVNLYARENNQWVLRQIITAAADFGYRVVFSGDGRTLVISSPAAQKIDGVATGSVWIYGQVADEWQLTQQIFADDGAQGHKFGEAIAINYDGSVLAVGAPSAPGTREGETGKVYLYRATWS